MRKIVTLLVSLLFIYSISHGQITKGNWMVGGNASYLSIKTKYESLSTVKYRYFNVSPNIGYFFLNKFAGGLRLIGESSKSVSNSNTTSSSSYTIGPYTRYYFLNEENQVNLFAEGSYQYQFAKPGNQNSNTFSFMAGPVIYFNSSVGLELTIRYSKINSSGIVSRNSIQLGVGFQIHLEKNN